MNYKMFHFNQTPNRLSAIRIGLKEILYAPFISFNIIFITALALFLAAASYIVRENTALLANKLNNSAEISIYLKKKINEKEISNLVEKLNSNPNIANVNLIEPDQGMKAFIENTNLDTLLSSFKDNPLPNVIIAQPEIKYLSHEQTQKLIQELNNLKEVETVNIDITWIQQSHTWLNLWNKLSLIFVLALCVNALFIVGGVSYIGSGFFSLKNKTHKIVLHYQFAWYGLIGSLLALLWLRTIFIILQNHEIILNTASIRLKIFTILAGILLSLISAKVGTSNKT